jgi:2-dehydropantoate 2-reductase
MTEVMILGAGAVGGYFGACLQRAGHDVTFVARGANLDALRTNGLRITGAMGDFALPSVNATEKPSGAADLVLQCVKNYDLDSVSEGLRDVGGIVLTMQNGVDAPYRVREIVGDRVLAGSTGIVADLPEPGHVHVVSDYAWIRYGELDGSGITDRVLRVRSWLDVGGIEPIPGPDARITLWEKMALMCAMAGLTSLHQRPMGELLGDPSLRANFEEIVGECFAVALAKGVPLSDGFVAERMAYAAGIDPDAMSSMSRDFKRGRKVELETFNGAVVRMGAELGIPVPQNAAVYDELRASHAHIAPS